MSTYKNPLVIDAASASFILPGDVVVDLVRWVGATTVGHEAIIQDGSGNEFWASKVAATPAPPEHAPLGYTCPGGLKVTTLGSGKLYIYHGRKARN